MHVHTHTEGTEGRGGLVVAHVHLVDTREAAEVRAVGVVEIERLARLRHEGRRVLGPEVPRVLRPEGRHVRGGAGSWTGHTTSATAGVRRHARHACSQRRASPVSLVEQLGALARDLELAAASRAGVVAHGRTCHPELGIRVAREGVAGHLHNRAARQPPCTRPATSEPFSLARGQPTPSCQPCGVARAPPGHCCARRGQPRACTWSWCSCAKSSSSRTSIAACCPAKYEVASARTGHGTAQRQWQRTQRHHPPARRRGDASCTQWAHRPRAPAQRHAATRAQRLRGSGQAQPPWRDLCPVSLRAAGTAKTADASPSRASARMRYSIPGSKSRRLAC